MPAKGGAYDGHILCAACALHGDREVLANRCPDGRAACYKCRKVSWPIPPGQLWILEMPSEVRLAIAALTSATDQDRSQPILRFAEVERVEMNGHSVLLECALDVTLAFVSLQWQDKPVFNSDVLPGTVKLPEYDRSEVGKVLSVRIPLAGDLCARLLQRRGFGFMWAEKNCTRATLTFCKPCEEVPGDAAVSLRAEVTFEVPARSLK